MKHARICTTCAGPDDPLHTPQECEAMVQMDQLSELDRYDLAVIAAVIARAGGALPAAVKLHELGWLKGRR